MSNRPSRTPSASARVRQASNSGRGGRTTWVWVGLVAVVAVVGLVAVMVSRSSDSSAGGASSPSGGTVVPNGDFEYGSVDVQGTPLAAAPDGSDPSATDTAVGQALPTVIGQGFDGNQITISPDGGPQIVMAVAHWCPHCQAEVPRLQKWLDDNGMPSDVKLTAVATSNDPSRPNFPAGPWLRKEGWSVPTIIDDKPASSATSGSGSGNDAAAALGVSGFPYFAVIGPDGKVVQRASGEITMTQWEALLEAARTGQPAQA